ncbi:hypothetical protein LDO26_15000 [Luteimonas sp. BDR2-5]|uniref:hypothetical protein n=1 Tax=Proluteimonas luteida TaxID=2878685 RepID=UPI001E304CA7|nr:hypothetical protein [Luteimonas sp. BDR2-5]MCD9029501.1 hypothetical protein [Luteimonas sp. BDR2-5]
MTPLFRKLNLKDQRSIVVLNAPESFEPELRALADAAVKVSRKVEKGAGVAFGIAFVITRKQLDEASAILAAAADGDAVLWMAYPKGTSKRYKCEFNRDDGWSSLGQAGFEAVRQVAIDENWSALRFRRVEFIKSLTRAPARAMTQAGKLRTTK